MRKQRRDLRLVVVVSVLPVLLGISGPSDWWTAVITHRTALHTAAENNDVAAIKEWIAHGKNLDQGLTYPGGLESTELRGVTALMLAAERGNEEAATALIEGGANIYLEDKDLNPYTVYNRTALDYAIAGGSRRIVSMLADRWKGEPLTRRGQEDLRLAWEHLCLAPYLARFTGPYADGKWVAGFVLDRLLTKEEAQRALVQASEQAGGCPDYVSFLLERHVPPTPEMLISAIRFDRAGLVRELLAAGADVNAPMVTRMAPGVSPPQTTMMPLAAGAKSQAMTKILLDAGARINGQDDEGRTALHYAVEGDWRYANDYSRLLATMDGIEFLVSRGARTDLRDKNGKTPGDYFGPNYHIIRLFRERMIAALELPPERFPREPGDHAAVLRACFDTNGDPTQTPEIVESSGVPKWDSAGVQLLTRGATRSATTGVKSQRGAACLGIAIDFPPPPQSNALLDFENCPPPPLRGPRPCNRPPTPVYACVTSSGYDELRVPKELRCHR